MTTPYYNLRVLAIDWGRETGEDTDVILDRLIRWAAAGGFPTFSFSRSRIRSDDYVSPDDLLDAWLALKGQRRPGHAIWEGEEANRLLTSVCVTGTAIGSFCQKLRVNPPEKVQVGFWLGWIRGRATVPPEPPKATPAPLPAETAVAGAEKACQKWIEEKAKTLESPPRRKDLWEEARRTFPKLSKRGFVRAWDVAAPEKWKRPGPKSPHRFESPKIRDA